MSRRILIGLSLLLSLAAPLASRADAIDALPVSVIFAVSSGYWEETGELGLPGPAPAPALGKAAPAAPQARRGYYKVVAVRQADRTAKVYLQQIASTEAGPSVINSVELEEFSAIKSYVTDVRTDNANGIARQPGLFATVLVKSDPNIIEPETWTILIDDLGDLRVERASN
jgi:hypothetical protein